MTRRDLLAALALGAAAPLSAAAQTAVPRPKVGVLFAYPEASAEGQRRATIVRESLAGLGWRDGESVELMFRFGENDPDRLGREAVGLARLECAVILASTIPALVAATAATSSTPIVFVGVSHPVEDGFVASLGRPGGNVTGFSSFEPSIAGKWLELVEQLRTSAGPLAVVHDPATTSNPRYLDQLTPLADAARIRVVPVATRPDAADMARAVAIAAGETRASSLLVLPSPIIAQHREVLISAARPHALADVYPDRSFAAKGGLASYGVDLDDLHRRAADYVDRILRGARPGDLPVQQATRFELVVNLDTAKARSIDVPPALLARADEVIE